MGTKNGNNVATNGPTNIDKFMVKSNNLTSASVFHKSSQKISSLFSFFSKDENTKHSTHNSGSSNSGSSWFSKFPGFSLSESLGSTLARIIAYIVAIVTVIFIILLFIHFFFKPIFSTHPGSPGIIRVPGMDDGKLFWDTKNPGKLLNEKIPIREIYYNYSINMDIFIQNPFQFSRYPRILFTRGAIYNPTKSGDTILGIINNYNLVIALLPDTNDLIVSVLNKDNNMENSLIPNVPVQEPFRLGVIIMESVLETYLNGQLIKTRPFNSPPKDVKGDIYPASGVELNIAKIRNLKIWPRVLTISEIRTATPSLSSSKDFGATQMPTTSSCATNITDRLNKLSLDTIPDIKLSDVAIPDISDIAVPDISDIALQDMSTIF